MAVGFDRAPENASDLKEWKIFLFMFQVDLKYFNLWEVSDFRGLSVPPYETFIK